MYLAYYLHTTIYNKQLTERTLCSAQDWPSVHDSQDALYFFNLLASQFLLSSSFCNEIFRLFPLVILFCVSYDIS